MSQHNDDSRTLATLIVMGAGEATTATTQVGLPEAQSQEASLLQQQQLHNSVAESPAGIIRPHQQTTRASNSALPQPTEVPTSVSVATTTCSQQASREADQLVNGEDNAMTIAPVFNQETSVESVQAQSHIAAIIAQSHAGPTLVNGNTQPNSRPALPDNVQYYDHCYAGDVQ